METPLRAQEEKQSIDTHQVYQPTVIDGLAYWVYRNHDQDSADFSRKWPQLVRFNAVHGAPRAKHGSLSTHVSAVLLSIYIQSIYGYLIRVCQLDVIQDKSFGIGLGEEVLSRL
jgi:hypothetical protein